MLAPKTGIIATIYSNSTIIALHDIIDLKLCAFPREIPCRVHNHSYPPFEIIHL